jgi:hypothetical protein
MDDINSYKAAEKRIEEEQIEQYAKDQSVLEDVKKQVPKGIFEEIKFEMEESEHYSNFRIVKEPIGDKQKNDNIGDSLNVWVEQHSVGDTGDSWAGVVTVQFSNGKYLAWNYWM